MGSRLKQNPEQTFYWFFEATCPVATDKDPGVLFQFPEDFNDEESCQTLPRFCFPYDIQRVRDGVAVQHFTFVLTDIEGCQRFGFCRLTNSTNTCLCILSYLPWFEVFYKLLNSLADYITKGQTNEMKALLAALYKQPVPLAAGSVTLQMGEQLLVSTEVSCPVGHPEGQEGVPYFIAPDPRSLPSIPENRNLTELIVAVDVGNLLQLYASMLFERRILIFASKLSTLTACVHALSAALYPMYWQHIFIPVLPPHLLDYCCAPMPYLIGVHTSLSERVKSRGLEEVVILNVDTNTLETPFDDLKRIPSDVISGLKVCLKRQAVTPGCGVSKAFLKAQALLFGGYRDALQGQQGSQIASKDVEDIQTNQESNKARKKKEGELWFSEELFLDHKSSSMRNFLQSAVHLQSFKQFIDSRLDVLNKGKEPDDLFEEEILKCETAAGRGKSYQQLVGNLKKGGGALILNMKSKANMRAKGLAKSGLKNLLIHKANNEENSLQRGGSVSHRRAQSDCLQNRLPITQHFGMSRPRRPGHKHRAPRDEGNTRESGDTWDGAVSDPVVELDSEHQRDEDEEQDSLLCDPEEMDLLGEIFDTLSTRSFHERGLLYGTRSLDLFGSDSQDYITKVGFPTNPSQESLSLSISGSGSLHSWNLEATEEQSDQAEDSDWLNPDTSMPEEEKTESLQPACVIPEQECKEEEERNEAVNREEEGENGDRGDFKEVEEEEEEVEDQGGSLGEDAVTETSENKEEESLKENTENEQKQGETVEEETDKETNDIQEEERESQENQLTVQSPRHPDPEATPAQDRRKEEAVKKVLSAVARFQFQEHNTSFQLKSRARDLNEPGRVCNRFQSRGDNQTQPRCDAKTPEEKNHSEQEREEEEEERPPIKVSELKKRFEG